MWRIVFLLPLCLTGCGHFQGQDPYNWEVRFGKCSVYYVPVAHTHTPGTQEMHPMPPMLPPAPMSKIARPDAFQVPSRGQWADERCEPAPTEAIPYPRRYDIHREPAGTDPRVIPGAGTLPRTLPPGS